MSKMLMLIDGNNLGFRGFNQVPLTWNGKRTETVFLGVKQVLHYMKTLHPNQVMLCYDGGRDERRTSVFPDYKKRKPLTPEEREQLLEFYRQLDELRKVFTAFGLPQVRIRGREADDIIYTICSRKPALTASFDEFVVVSTDWDYYQLLTDPQVKVYSPIKGEMIDHTTAKERLGFDDLSQYPFWKAVIGGHDGIPGINGVGRVAATFFVNHKGEDAATYPPRFRNLWQKVRASYEDVAKWTKLAEFCAVEEQEIMDHMLWEPQRNYMEWCKKAMGVLEEYGFREFKEGFVDFSSPWRDYFLTAGGTHGE